MRRPVFFAVFVFLLTSLTVVRPAGAFTEAGEAYIYPTFSELTQTTLMLGGMDMTKPEILDEYIRMMYCDLYRENFTHDFAWHEIEKQILARVNSKTEYYRSLYQLGGVIELGQYDFQNRHFPLISNTAFQNVGYMELFSEGDFKPYCEVQNPVTGAITMGGRVFPIDINIVLSEPLSLTAIKASKEQAQNLLDMFAKMRSQKRILYIRFRFRVQSVQSKRAKTDLNGEIVSIDIFYDKEMTKWLMSVPLR